MGRQRTINDQAFWRSPKLTNCTLEDRVVLLHALTCPASGIVGVYPQIARIAAAELGWSAEQWLQVVERLGEYNLLSYDTETQCIWPKIWWEHHSAPQCCGPKLIRRTVQELLAIPEGWRDEYFTEFFRRVGPTLSSAVIDEAKSQGTDQLIRYRYGIQADQEESSGNKYDYLYVKPTTTTPLDAIDLSVLPYEARADVAQALSDAILKGELKHCAVDVVDEIARLYRIGGEQRPRNPFALTTYLAKHLKLTELERDRQREKNRKFETEMRQKYVDKCFEEPGAEPKKYYKILPTGHFEQISMMSGKLTRACSPFTSDFAAKIDAGQLVEVSSSVIHALEGWAASPGGSDD